MQARLGHGLDGGFSAAPGMRGLLAILAVAAAAGNGAAAPPRSADPAPPRLLALPDGTPSPVPRAHPRARFVRRPRPPDPRAVLADWPCFLGATHDGVSSETGLRDRFDAGADALLCWAVTRGESYAAPSVVDGRVVHFHRLGDRETIECLDAETAELLWVQDYPTAYRDRFHYLNGPRATPALDSGRVYTLGAEGVLACHDLRTGHRYWLRQLRDDFALNEGFFGFATSPLIEGERVILNLGEGKSVAAFDKRTGVLDWLSAEPWGRSYATPLVATMSGRRVLLVFAGGMTEPPDGGLLGLDPATGTTHFRFPWRSPRYFSANACSPVVQGQRVFISSSYDVYGALLEIGPDLAVTLAYRTRAYASHWATPILKDGYLYGFQNNQLTCMEWGTGKRIWQRVLRWGPTEGEGDAPPRTGHGADQYREPPDAAGFGLASLTRVGDRFLCLGETGLLAWLELTPDGCAIISACRLFHAPQTWTAPVLSRGLLFVVQNCPGAGEPARLLGYDLRGPCAQAPQSRARL